MSERPAQTLQPRGAAPTPDTDLGWPLVGRAGELTLLRALLLDERRSVVLAGPAGVGKTRVGAELLAVAGQAGHAVAQVTATRAAGEIPFGAFAGLLPNSAAPGVGSVDNRADWLRRCVASLAALGGRLPLVLMVDDLHLLDGPSAAMLHQAVAARACLLVATLRTGESAPDPVVALWKDGLAVRHDLAGLTEHDTAALLVGALGGPVDAAAVSQLFSQSRGNALYLRELVRGATGAGTLVADDGLWRLTGRAPLSNRLVELVETRLAGLSVPERSLLELVAYGEPLGPAEIQALSGERLAEDLEERGFLASRRDGRRLQIRLAHPVYADALLARLPALRAQRLARTLADLVEATGARRREDLLRIATWRLEGGGVRPELMLRAAATARWSYDFPLAERLARAAAHDGAGFEAHLLTAQLVYLQGRGHEADEELARLATTARDDEQRGRVALARLECAIFLGQVQPGLEIAERAERAIIDPTWRNQVTARRAGLLLAATGPRAAVEVAAPLLQRSDGHALVWACLVASLGLGRLGRLDDAVAAADLGHATQLTITTPLEYYPWLHTYFRGDALIYAGRLAEAAQTAREQYDLAVRHRSTEAQAYFGFQLAKSVGEHGDVGPAVRFAREAAALFRELGRPALLEPCLTDLVVSLALSGRAGEATEALERLDRLGLPRSYYAVEVLRARAWAAISRGALAEARDHLDDAARVGEQTGDLVGALEALHTLARIGHARQVLQRVNPLADRIDGTLARARADHVTALAERDESALHAVALRFEGIGAHLLAAEAAAEAAVAAHKRATPQRAAVLRREAARLRQLCPQAITPALGTASARAQLTPAEAEAARLAAAGYSNRDIAGRLHISVRTVEGQLQRSYEKLSITRRSELAQALDDPGRDRPT